MIIETENYDLDQARQIMSYIPDEALVKAIAKMEQDKEPLREYQVKLEFVQDTRESKDWMSVYVVANGRMSIKEIENTEIDIDVSTCAHFEDDLPKLVSGIKKAHTYVYPCTLELRVVEIKETPWEHFKESDFRLDDTATISH